MLIYLTLAVLPTSRRAWSPTPGLRGLAAAMQAGQQPGDAIILFHALDYGLAPYWPNLPANQPLQFDTTHPIPPQMHALRAELAALGPGSRIWVAYRDDFYFRQNPTAYSALCEAISAHHRIIRIFWQEAEYTLLLAEPVRAAP